ncbi:MAG: hypothetical protein R3227_03205, partial [Reinekea sp.]|nr:hypothetical protein [Reinekea sp.]
RRLMLILEQLNQRKALYVMEGTELYEVYTVYRGLEVYPLQTMYRLATEAGVPLFEWPEDDPRYQVPATLQTLYERWQQEDHGQFHKAPKRLKEYIHRSDRVGLANHAGDHREWFPNQPDLAVKPRNRHEKTA